MPTNVTTASGTRRRKPCTVIGERPDGAWEIGLTRGLVAVIDAADLDAVVGAGSWHASKRARTAYAARRIGGRYVLLHGWLTGWDLVDCIDGDGLNCRRSNLRPATRAESGRSSRQYVSNTSGFRGVTWDRARGRWLASIRIDGRRLHLGRFDNPVEAAEAYDRAARELHGEFASPNFANTLAA